MNRYARKEFIEKLSPLERNLYENLDNSSSYYNFHSPKIVKNGEQDISDVYGLFSIVEALMHESFEFERNEVCYSKQMEKYKEPKEVFQSKYFNKSFIEVIQAESDDGFTPAERLTYTIFKTYPELLMLLEKDVSIINISISVHKRVAKGRINSDFELSVDPTVSIENMVSAFNSAINKSCNPDLNKIYRMILEIVLNDSKNEYRSQTFQQFTEMFKGDESEREISSECFYKSPRTRDVSNSGYIDMAYHALLNQSNIMKSFIEKTHSMHKI